MNSKFIIGGLLAGAAAGIAIGMLLSPAGERVREKLKKGAGKLSNSFGETPAGESLKDGFNRQVDDLANKGKEFIDVTSQKVKA